MRHARDESRLSRSTTLNSDGGEHDRRRKLVAHRLLPRALRAISDGLDANAVAVVDAALSKGEGDGVTDLAVALPMAVVPDLIGWPRNHRAHLIDWGGTTFDVLGPLNWQAIRSTPQALRMLHFARRVVRQRAVLDGSMAHELLRAADEGKLSHSECPPLMVDYLAPSIDTTMSAISDALYLFAIHPEAMAAPEARAGPDGERHQRWSSATSPHCAHSRVGWVGRLKSAV